MRDEVYETWPLPSKSSHLVGTTDLLYNINHNKTCSDKELNYAITDLKIKCDESQGKEINLH